jgi:hypothetical protein
VDRGHSSGRVAAAVAVSHRSAAVTALAPVVWAAGVATVVTTALTPGPMEYLPDMENPLGLERAGWVLDLLAQVAFAVIAAAVFAAAGSLILRWRRARGVERQQLKWLAYAAAMLMLLLVVTDFLPHGLFAVAATSMTLLFPVATGIAVVRYRLYDIDRIINRTLVYGLLTALLGAVYAGMVLVLGQIVWRVGGNARAGWWPAPPWLWPPCSNQPGDVSKQRLTGASTEARITRQDSRGIRCSAPRRTRPGRAIGRTAGGVDQTMQPTIAALWLRPSAPARPRGQG